MKIYVYHCYAYYETPSGQTIMDGIVRAERKIDSVQEYTLLKEEMHPENPDKLFITNLSFLGSRQGNAEPSERVLDELATEEHY